MYFGVRISGVALKKTLVLFAEDNHMIENRIKSVGTDGIRTAALRKNKRFLHDLACEFGNKQGSPVEDVEQVDLFAFQNAHHLSNGSHNVQAIERDMMHGDRYGSDHG